MLFLLGSALLQVFNGEIMDALPLLLLGLIQFQFLIKFQSLIVLLCVAGDLHRRP